MAFRTELPAKPKTDESREALSHQIEALKRIAKNGRDKQLGQSWHEDVKNLYTLIEGGATPSFRPKVDIPQLQVLMLNEATDLTDNNPRILITLRDPQTKKSKRDKDHEEAFMAHWNQGFWSNKILVANLWALFAKVGYIQVGFDPKACRGQGRVWAEVVDPETVYTDPFAKCDEDMTFLILERKPYLDQVRSLFPERGHMVKRPVPSSKTDEAGDGGSQFQMPAGPMSMNGNAPSTSAQIMGDGRVTVNYLFARDSTIEDIPVEERHKYPKGTTKRPKYPNGRMTVECEGVVLYDGENPTPLGMFPIISFISMPRLTDYIPPSAVQYTKGIQSLAEKIMTQIFENTVRMNNSMAFVSEQSGINIDNFGGMPAEVHMVQGDPNAAVAFKNPAAAALPTQIIDLPKYLLELQKNLQGFTPARLGEPTQGNVAKDLYGMSIYESQKLTRMRGRLMAESVQRFCELAFYTMAKFYQNNISFPVFQADSETFLADWEPIAEPQLGDFDVHVDPASIRPVSATALKSLAMPLAQMGALPTDELLKAVEYPGADEVAEKVKAQQTLAAIANINSGKKK